MNVILVDIIIVLVLGVPLFLVGQLTWKRSQNARKCRGAYLCLFRGPDRSWVRLLPARNGLIQKPAGKYLLKKEKVLNIPWPEAGYVIPKDMRIPPIEYPFTGSSFTKVTVGLLVYDIGNPMPRGYVTDSEIDPSTIDAINDSKIAMDIFSTIPNELRKDEKKSGGTTILPWIAIALSGIALILIFIVLTHQGSIASNVDTIKKGLGY
jgi:hypothetical protein